LRNLAYPRLSKFHKILWFSSEITGQPTSTSRTLERSIYSANLGARISIITHVSPAFNIAEGSYILAPGGPSSGSNRSEPRTTGRSATWRQSPSRPSLSSSARAAAASPQVYRRPSPRILRHLLSKASGFSKPPPDKSCPSTRRTLSGRRPPFSIKFCRNLFVPISD
jgi:hypothetical protein